MSASDKADESQLEQMDANESGNIKVGLGPNEEVSLLANLSAEELKLRERKLLRKLDLRMILTLLVVSVRMRSGDNQI
jgi:hypothetical protein